jgi:hypothetical protein
MLQETRAHQGGAIMTDLNRASGFKESAQRIEEVLEVVRAEIGPTAKETDWAGLARHIATGAAETKGLAFQLAKSQDGDGDDALLSVFILRQLEICLAFISKLSDLTESLQKRLEHMESELAELQSRQ